jgi:hypothetical protein
MRNAWAERTLGVDGRIKWKGVVGIYVVQDRVCFEYLDFP